jgi:hypothetical protein
MLGERTIVAGALGFLGGLIIATVVMLYDLSAHFGDEIDPATGWRATVEQRLSALEGKTPASRSAADAP